jgi:hypothetical protein
MANEKAMLGHKKISSRMTVVIIYSKYFMKIKPFHQDNTQIKSKKIL